MECFPFEKGRAAQCRPAKIERKNRVFSAKMPARMVWSPKRFKPKMRYGATAMAAGCGTRLLSPFRLARQAAIKESPCGTTPQQGGGKARLGRGWGGWGGGRGTPLRASERGSPSPHKKQPTSRHAARPSLRRGRRPGRGGRWGRARRDTIRRSGGSG